MLCTKLFVLSLTDQLEQSKVKIYSDFVSMSQTGVLIYTNTADISNFTVHLDPPTLLRIIGITNERDRLTICEVKLIENGNMQSLDFNIILLKHLLR